MPIDFVKINYYLIMEPEDLMVSEEVIERKINSKSLKRVKSRAMGKVFTLN